MLKRNQSGSFSSMITNPDKPLEREESRSIASDKNDRLIDMDDRNDSDSNDSIERERYKISNY